MKLIDNTVMEAFEVPTYATDEWNNLTPAFFMKVLENDGGLHAEAFGMGHADLLRERLAWVVSRLHIHFNRPLKWRENVVFSTWHMGQEDGLFFRREAMMATPQGEAVVTATTGWLLINLDTRAMVRHCNFASRPDSFRLEKVIEEPAPRLRIPAGVEMKTAYTYQVKMSDLDRNHHVNNTQYARFAMDALPEDVVRENDLRDFYINFVHEARLGDELEVRIGREPDAPGHIFYVEGLVQGKSSFLVKIVL